MNLWQAMSRLPLRVVLLVITSTIQALPGQLGLDVLWRFLGLEFPACLASVPLLDICCCERDLALSLELAADLAVQGLLVGLDRQEKVGPLLQAPAKNACVVCSASAWIRTPLRSSVLSSSLSAAFSLDSWVS